ncbi:MAG: FecR domain-containing protein [Prolixibacteraceae bacterium]
MESEDQFFGKISEYYSGEKSQEVIKKELESNPETKELFHWIDRFWNSLRPKAWDTANIERRTHEKIREAQSPEPLFRSRPVKYAAAILLALSVSGFAYYYFTGKDPLIEVTSGTGELKVVDLPDGSKVWLNAQSSLRYPEKFKGELREVTMNGEVYFQVKSDSEHPFIVHSDHIQVSVLGTRFLVSDHANEPVIHTYLAEGSIELELKDLKESITLVPGEEVSYDKKTLAVLRVNNPQASFDSWRFGKLSFYNESLFEIGRKLERKFGKMILIEENVEDMKFTADFESETLEQILDFFSLGSHLGYRPTESGYIITSK